MFRWGAVPPDRSGRFRPPGRRWDRISQAKPVGRPAAGVGARPPKLRSVGLPIRLGPRFYFLGPY